ncbi:MAG: SusC/RagA family TonB-linked outer membrane protein [Ferruginibacter sp.]|nr:SusC/RagA family TonB-linked outer membrane protein [Ferruginibacter sp.]
MRKAILTLLVVFGFVLIATAQERSINGIVTNDKGTPIEGVSVTSSDNKKGTKTDKNGSYTITVITNAKSLLYSSVGFETQRKNISNLNTINLALKATDSRLDEIVVVAYGTVKKDNFTGSAAKIAGNEFDKRTLTSVTNALTGSVAGLSTTSSSGQPGSTPAIRVRGFGSISASNEPLIVVDGIPATSALSNINMDDVESLTVLKDAATTSLYGSRAANGVVMVTTKKGKKGKSVINFKYNYSLTSRGIPNYDRVSAEEYMPLMWESYRNSLAYRASTPLPLATASNQASGLVAGQNGIIDLLGYNAFNLPKAQVMLPNGTLNPSASLVYKREDLDWFDPITRNGTRNEYSLNYGGGEGKTDYFVSGAYTKENGYIKRSDFERANARINVNSQLKDWVKIGLNFGYINSKGNFASTDGSNSIVNPFFFAAKIGPIFPYYAYDPANPGSYKFDANGNKQYDFGNSTIAGLPTRPSGAYGGRHTIAENELSSEFFKRNVFNGRAYAEIKLLNGLKFTTNIGADITNRLDVNFANKVIGDGAPAGRVTRENTNNSGLTFNQLLNYNKKARKHNFDVLAGHESYQFKENYLATTRQGQIVDNNLELINFTTTTNATSKEDNYNLESYFGNFRYDYNNKYFFTLGGRTDGNSKYSKKFRWGKFWSISAAWVLTKENFFNNSKYLSLLKLRTSYGTTGNDAGIGYYASKNLYTLGRNNGLTPGIYQYTVGFDGLLWESNKQFDLALDFGILKNRITGSIEYYKRESDNLLFDIPLPNSSGFSTILKNIGSMNNKGIEISINADVVRYKDFTWNIAVNASSFKNNITKLPQAEIITGTKKLMVGHSLYDYWLRQWYGVDPADGVALYRAANTSAADVRTSAKGDFVTPNINNALYDYSGSAIPDWYGGITSTFNYKGFSLSILANWQKGGLTYDDTYAAFMHSGTYGASLHRDMLTRWQKPGDITNVPRMDNGQTGNFGAVSTRWLTDASYFNIQNITLGYDFKNTNFFNIKNINSARFYIAIENVKMFSKRQGMNPSQSFTGLTSIGYLPAKVFNVGLNFNF